MSECDFAQILESLPALSPQQLHTLRQEVDSQLAASSPPAGSDEALQRRLLAAGVVSEVKPPRRVPTGTEAFTPIAVTGEPVSETITRERR